MSFCLFASLFLAGNQISYCDGMILIYLLVTDCGQLCSPDNNDCLANRRRRRRTRRESVMSHNKNKLTPPPRRPSWLDTPLPMPHQMTPSNTCDSSIFAACPFSCNNSITCPSPRMKYQRNCPRRSSSASSRSWTWSRCAAAPR